MEPTTSIKKVICDTNIWYNLGNGTILPPIAIPLIATWSNVIELAYAHPKNKIDFDINKWKQAAQAILKHSTGIIELDPFEFATKRLFPDYSSFNQRDLKSVLTIISETRNPLAESIYIKNQRLFDSFISIKADFVSKLLQFKSEARPEFVKSSALKEAFKKNQKDYFKIRSADILFDVDAYLSKKNKTIVFDNHTDIQENLKRVEREFSFYVHVKQRFLHNLTLMKSMSVQPNDFIDLTNLMYVDNESYYATLENRWSTLINEAGQESKLIKIESGKWTLPQSTEIIERFDK